MVNNKKKITRKNPTIWKKRFSNGMGRGRRRKTIAPYTTQRPLLPDG
jgi:hypothetical protein